MKIDREMAVGVYFLRHIADPRAGGPRNCAAVGNHAEECAQEDTLARTVRADDRECVPFFKFKTDIPQRGLSAKCYVQTRNGKRVRHCEYCNVAAAGGEEAGPE